MCQDSPWSNVALGQGLHGCDGAWLLYQQDDHSHT